MSRQYGSAGPYLPPPPIGENWRPAGRPGDHLPDTRGSQTGPRRSSSSRNGTSPFVRSDMPRSEYGGKHGASERYPTASCSDEPPEVLYNDTFLSNVRVDELSGARGKAPLRPVSRPEEAPENWGNPERNRRAERTENIGKYHHADQNRRRAETPKNWTSNGYNDPRSARHMERRTSAQVRHYADYSPPVTRTTSSNYTQPYVPPPPASIQGDKHYYMPAFASRSTGYTRLNVQSRGSKYSSVHIRY